jgi:hypothetical protein
MRWVKFGERFPSDSDHSSVSIDDEVVVRRKDKNSKYYCELIWLGFVGRAFKVSESEWLEGAFEVEVNK